MRFKSVALIALAFVAAPAAAAIVDTGTPSNPAVAWQFNSNQWLGAEFTAPAATLTDLAIYSEGSGTFHVAVYTVAGSLPGTELFSAATTAATTGFNGVHGVSWAVDAGDYFVTFEVRAGDTFYGGAPNPSPNPLGVEVFFRNNAYRTNNGLDIGVQVDGTIGGIPEPTTWSLLIGGFALSGVALRRRKTALA